MDGLMDFNIFYNTEAIFVPNKTATQNKQVFRIASAQTVVYKIVTSYKIFYSLSFYLCKYGNFSMPLL